jgi:S-DNA-T family DNA segregation ATPase FtsK/SpoIIIE
MARYSPGAAPRSEYGAVEWLRAHRVALGPLYAAVAVLAVGVGVHLISGLQAMMVGAAVAVGGLYWAARAAGWRRHYYRIVIVAALGWLLAAHLAPSTVPAWVWLVVSLILEAVLLAIPWWSDSVRRTHVGMEAMVRAWPVRSARVGLPGTWLSGMTQTNIGWAGQLNWLPGQYDPSQVGRNIATLEGALGLQVGQLRMPLNGKDPNSIQLVAVKNDPHAKAQMWDIPHAEQDGQLVMRHLKADMDMDTGIQEDGVLRKIRLWVPGVGSRHVLIAGVTGSGKSGLLNLLWAQFALCRAVVQWGIDLKGGMELGPWRGAFDRIVDNREDAIVMLRAVDAEMKRRMAVCKAAGDRVWRVSVETPLLVVSVDECASLLGNANQSELELVAEITRKGRAVGIVLILATQYPTLEAVGTTQVRENMQHRFCFRMQNSQGERHIMPDHTINAHQIDSDRPGTCYHLDGNKLDKMTMRVLYLDDETVSVVVGLVSGDVETGVAATTGSLGDEAERWLAAQVPELVSSETGLDGETETGLDGETETGLDETVSVPSWDDDGDVDLGEVTSRYDETLSETERDEVSAARVEAEPPSLDSEAAYAALVAALQAGGSAGVSPTELMAACTRKSTWLYDNLTELEAKGRVRRARAGTWVWSGGDRAVHLV